MGKLQEELCLKLCASREMNMSLLIQKRTYNQLNMNHSTADHFVSQPLIKLQIMSRRPTSDLEATTRFKSDSLVPAPFFDL